MRKLLVVCSFLFSMCLPVIALAQTTIRVNAGGPAYRDTKGQSWSADYGFNTGSLSHSAPSATVTGTSDPSLFKSARVGVATTPDLQYQFAVANGLYKVNVYLAETYYTKVGSRIFDVQMQGATVFSGVDIFAQAGLDHPLVKSAQVSVTGGEITIRFAHRANANVPVISAIEILPSSSQSGSLASTPASASFGSVVVGSTNSQTINLKNNGTASVTISQANVSGTGFSISGLAVPKAIAAGGSTTFNVAFSPTSTSSVSGSVSLVNTASSSPLAISLSGSGLAAAKSLGTSPASLSFGNVPIGSGSTLSVTLMNKGNSNVTISSVAPSGTGFSATGVTAGTTLAPSQIATLNVTFDPKATGSASGSVSVSSNAANSPMAISLSGMGGTQSGLDLTPPNCGIQSTAALVPSASAWQNFTPPAVGGTYTDPGYCTVKRITNIGSGGQMIPFYSLVQTISAGDTKLLLFNGDAAHWNIYDLNGNVVISGSAFASATAENSDEPRWDRFDDAAIWGTRGNSIQKCTITMGTPGSMSCAITHTFSEYSKGVVFPADSDMNANGWVPMAGQNVAGGQVEIFMYQPSTNTKAGVYDPPGCTGSINTNEPGCIHRLIATPDNGMSIEGVGAGDKLWRPPFAGAPVQWDPSPDHHSVGYAIDGTTLVGAFEDFDNSGSGGPCYWRPVIAGFTSPGNPGSCPLFPNGQTSNPPEFGWHVSYMDHATRPWVVWTMMGNGTGPECFNAESCYKAPVAWNQSGGNWYPYQAEIVMARVDSNMTSVGQATNKVYRLALSHARQHADAGYYWQDVYAPVSWDGKYVVFSSNAAFAHNPSGCPSGGFSGDCADTYLIGPLF